MGKKKETKETEEQAHEKVEQKVSPDGAIYRGKETVCIVGCSDSKRDTPFDMAGKYEFWGVNNLFLSLPGPYTRWFEIHTISQDEKGTWLRRGSTDFRGQPVESYLRDLSRLPCPVYMQKQNPLVPNSIPYPYAPVVSSFGDYFTNTISWEIALAIAEGFREIRIYGVDMAVDCLTPESKVLKEDLTWVQGGDLNVGDKILGFDENPKDGDGHSRRWRPAEVLRKKIFRRPCYRIGLEDGTEFTATAKHGWLTHAENTNRWKTTDQLVTNRHRKNRPTRICRLVELWREMPIYSSGYLAAAFDGEASLHQGKRRGHFKGTYTLGLSFAQKDNAMLEYVIKYLSEHGFRYSVTNNYKDVRQVNVLGGRPSILRFLGSIRPKRLLAKFDSTRLGELQAEKYVAVEECTPIGERDVVGFETTTKTFVAEGMASHNSEYGWQRPSCEYFLGLAVGRGIKVWVPDDCDLLKTRFKYGFEDVKSLAWDNKVNAMEKKLNEKLNQCQQQAQFHQKQADQYIGAIQSLREGRKIWKNVTGG